MSSTTWAGIGHLLRQLEALRCHPRACPSHYRPLPLQWRHGHMRTESRTLAREFVRQGRITLAERAFAWGARPHAPPLGIRVPRSRIRPRPSVFQRTVAQRALARGARKAAGVVSQFIGRGCFGLRGGPLAHGAAGRGMGGVAFRISVSGYGVRSDPSAIRAALAHGRLAGSARAAAAGGGDRADFNGSNAHTQCVRLDSVDSV